MEIIIHDHCNIVFGSCTKADFHLAHMSYEDISVLSILFYCVHTLIEVLFS